ncbi:MAG: hypothetical protein ACOYN4_00375 [Bacteroidales bacterium]
MKKEDYNSSFTHCTELIDNTFSRYKLTIYECPPIDYWKEWDGFFSQSEVPFNDVRIKPISIGFFRELSYFLFQLSKTGRWDGTIRDLAYSFNGQELFFALKMDSNGTTFISSNYPLAIEVLADLLDEKEEVDLTEKIFDNWPSHCEPE